MDIKPLLKYGTPFLVNGAWFLVTYPWLKLPEPNATAAVFSEIGIAVGAIVGGTVLNLALGVVNLVRGRQVIGYTYFLLLLGVILFWKRIAAGTSETVLPRPITSIFSIAMPIAAAQINGPNERVLFRNLAGSYPAMRAQSEVPV